MFGMTVRDESEVFAELGELCTSPGYIHIIAYFCGRDNFIRYGDKILKEDLEHQYSESRLVRTEISTLIGLLVRQPIDFTTPSAEQRNAAIERTQELMLELHYALTKPWMESFKSGVDRSVDPFTQGASLREPIFYGGESAYLFQYRELAEPKYQADDAWLESTKGFRIGQARSVASAVGAIVNERQLAVRKTINPKKNPEWSLLPGFEFNATEVAERSGVELAAVERILDAFALPADDRNEPFTALNEFNATNATPLLRKDNATFLLLQHYSLVEAIYETPFFWMLTDRAYKATALTHRGAFTEDFSAECLTKVFGKARVYRNVDVYRSKGERLSEIDVLVLFGDRALVVQNKSKRLTIEARKGNDLQLQDDFKKAVQDAADQAMLCAEALVAGGHRLVDGNGTEVALVETFREVFPMCVVSDHYPALAFQARHFLKFRSDGTVRPPMVTDIFALDAMTEMLQSPLHLLNYLHARARFGGKLLVSHELTTLSFHLKESLWLGGEYDMVTLGDDIALDLDTAMMARREGLPGAKTPEGILTRLNGTAVGRLIAEIEASADPSTTSLGLWLLSLNEGTLRTVSKGLDQLVSEARRDGQNHDMTVTAGDPSSGLTVHCNHSDQVEATKKLLAHCNLRKYSQKADSWFGLLLKPQDGTVRLGLSAFYPWELNPEMERLAATLPPPRPGSIFSKPAPAVKPKIGRNDPCPCGSGRKLKKCCL